jgi:cytochrome c oxidase subunit 2
MLRTGFTGSSILRHAPVAQAGQSQTEVFDQLYLVFLVLGTLVGTLVIAYTVYNAYKYRTTDPDADGRYDVDQEKLAETDEYDVARPQQGEIPTGQGKGGGKKLFMSFGMSAVLVLGLIIYSYSLLLYVEDTGENAEDAIEVDVEGYQFGWDYTYFEDEYDNEEDALHSSDYNATELHPEAGENALVVPEGTVVQLDVTSRDVWHNYGIPEFRAKTDAIPDQTTNTWFEADETGLYEANCYELCGQGHSNMKGDVVVVEQQEFVDWYASQENTSESHIDFMEVSS